MKLASNSQNTALHIAVKNENPEMINLLLNYEGIDQSIKNRIKIFFENQVFFVLEWLKRIFYGKLQLN